MKRTSIICATIFVVSLLAGGCANSREFDRWMRKNIYSTQQPTGQETAKDSWTLPGYTSYQVGHGVLWVFKNGSPELAAWEKDKTLPENPEVRVNGASGRRDLYTPNKDIMIGYLASVDGFAVHLTETEIWVFRTSSPDGQAWLKDGTLPEEGVYAAGAREDQQFSNPMTVKHSLTIGKWSSIDQLS